MRLTFLIITLFLCAEALFSQNSCEMAVSVHGADGLCQQIDFSDATSDSFNTDCIDDLSSNNQWFYFTAEGPELNVVANHENNLDVFISLIRFTSGDCDPVKYTTIECGTNNLFGNDLLTIGNTYYLIVNVKNNEAGTVEFCVNNPDITPPPVNNLPCDAEVITPDSICLTGTTVYAEPDIDTFQCSPEYTNEVWYEFTLSDGLFFGVEVYLSGISLNGDVRVALVEFVNEDCNNDFIIRQQYCGAPNGFLFDYVSLEPSKKYFLAVATSPEDQGEFNLCVKEMEALAHTDPCNALEVVPNDACISFDTYYSLFEYDLPNCDFSNQKIWYKFYTGTDLDEISLELKKLGQQENIFLGLGYFQGNWCENQFHWVETYCGDVANAKFEAKDLMPYQVYHIVVGTNFGFTGQFDLCIDGDYNSPYTNDSPCKAYDIDNISNCIGGTSEYGAFIENDTLCFGVTLIKKSWYKIDLSRFDENIQVEFDALSDIPLHRLELGYFENGCLDSFQVMNQYCGTNEASTTVFAFPDSLDYAYVTISVPSDQNYNFSICVNPTNVSQNCRDNDFCQEAIAQGQVTMGNELCFSNCTFGTTSENTEEYYTSHYNTVWNILETGDAVTELQLEFENPTSAAFFIGINEQSPCDYNAFEKSRFVQLTGLSTISFDVEPNKIYYMAVAAIDDFGGSLDICVKGIENNTCSTKDILTIKSTSLGSPLEGPFQVGEEINFCYTIEEFDVVSEASCQWLQGIVPSFGNAWSSSSFDVEGLPQSATSITALSQDVNWAWRSDVHSRIDNTNRRIGDSPFGHTELCHVNEQNCDGQALQQGDLLPPGWYAWNNSQGIEHPDSTYGDGTSCSTANGPWEICFDLLVGELTDDSDLSISFHTFSDGEIGLEGQMDSSCMDDMPLTERFFVECDNQPIDTSLSFLTCSKNISLVDLPENQFYFWISTGNDRIEGVSNGSGTSFQIQLEHNEPDIQIVQYLLKAYTENGCHVANYTIDVEVYPELNIAREDLFTVCQTDSVSMSEVIDLDAQIIGSFEVEWNSNNLINEADAVWLDNQGESISYSVISEAGCTYEDSIFIHVEDVIVEEFIQDFIVCKDDEFNMNEVIALESIISDNFSVDWEIDGIDDLPSASFSLEESTVIPFTIEGETGCIYSNSLSINVPFVDINVLGKDEYCSTDTVSISAGYQFDLPHTKYWILPNNDTINSSGLSRPASIFETGINLLEFQLYTEEGCPFYDFDTIEVFDYPEFTFNQDNQLLGICPYDSLDLNLTVEPSYFDVSWNTPTGMTNEKMLNIKDEGWYTVEAGFENNSVSCINRDSFYLEIFPAVQTEFLYDSIICIGDSALIESVDPNYIFVWSTGDFSSAVKLPGGEYSVTVSNGPGCNNIFDIDITEQELPVPDFEFEDSFCLGDSTWIIATNPNYDFQWSNNADSSAILSFGEDVSVTVTDNEACVDSFEIEIEVIEYPEVDFSFELINDSLYLQNNAENAEFCEWMINDDLLGTAEDTLIILPEGDYIIALSCNNGPCSDIVIDSFSVILVGLEAQSLGNWNLYPNPNNGFFKVYSELEKDIEKIEIIDLYGNKVFSKRIAKSSSNIEVDSQLLPGIYFVEISFDGVKQGKRIIIQ